MCVRPKFEAVKRKLFSGRANNAIALAYMQPGDRLLELGCGDGTTLASQNDALGVATCGVELSSLRMEQARSHGVRVELTPLDTPNWTFENVDHIQAFHFLQRLPNPSAWLTKCWESLAVGGRIVLDVPNLYHPHGSLTSHFLRPTYLHTWSESTLSALLKRSGFVVERVVSTLTLFAVGRKASSERQELPFAPSLLSRPDHDHAWISARLKNYEAMETTRATMLREGPSMDSIHRLVHQLMQPAFSFHVVDVILELVDLFLSHQAVGLACLITTAASQGPYDAELTTRMARLAVVLREEGTGALGLQTAAPAPLPTRRLADKTARGRMLGAPRPVRGSAPRGPVELLMSEIRGEFQTRLNLQLNSSAPFYPLTGTVAQA